MDITKTLRYKITNHSRIFDATIDIYNHALSLMIDVIDREFDHLKDMTIKSVVPAVEKLIHVTKSNPLPKYREFNQRFYKFPSYLRRSAIASALLAPYLSLILCTHECGRFFNEHNFSISLGNN